MSEKPWPGPPAGVSTTDGQGGYKPIDIEVPIPASNRRTRRQMPGEDVLQNVHELKAVQEAAGMNPAGVQAVSRDVRIGKMPKTRRSRKHTRSFRSVDGQEYTFRSHDTKGKELESNRIFMVIAALREVSLGGNPQVVFDAWGLRITDMDAQQYYPPSQETLERMMADREVQSMMGVESEDDSGHEQFALGTNE